MTALSHRFYSYLITDPNFYTSDQHHFKHVLSKVLSSHKVDMICFRDKVSHNFDDLAKYFLEICSKFQIEKIFINQKLSVASKLNATGIHLTSNQFSEIEIAKSLGLEVIISCHTLEEIRMAQHLGADFATISPIFNSPNKGEPIGIEILNKAKEIATTTKIIALGGIDTNEKLELVKSTDADGFASIRYFVN